MARGVVQGVGRPCRSSAFIRNLVPNATRADTTHMLEALPLRRRSLFSYCSRVGLPQPQLFRTGPASPFAFHLRAHFEIQGVTGETAERAWKMAPAAARWPFLFCLHERSPSAPSLTATRRRVRPESLFFNHVVFALDPLERHNLAKSRRNGGGPVGSRLWRSLPPTVRDTFLFASPKLQAAQSAHVRSFVARGTSRYVPHKRLAMPPRADATVRAAVRRVCGHFLSARAKRLCQPTPRSLLLVLPRRTPKLTPEMLFARHLARCFGGALPRRGRTDPVSLLWRRLPVTVQNYFLFFFRRRVKVSTVPSLPEESKKQQRVNRSGQGAHAMRGFPLVPAKPTARRVDRSQRCHSGSCGEAVRRPLLSPYVEPRLCECAASHGSGALRAPTCTREQKKSPPRQPSPSQRAIPSSASAPTTLPASLSSACDPLVPCAPQMTVTDAAPHLECLA